MKKFLKILGIFLITLLVLVITAGIVFHFMTQIDPPVPGNTDALKLLARQIGPDFYACKNNRLKKSDSGLWEMYLEGNPFERGVINGKLSEALIKSQEQAFVDQINEIIPSKTYLRYLRYFVSWFNRNIDSYIPKEYLLEIYGTSYAASGEFSFIGTNFERMLNYHAAHDIGHALKDYNMVGCTSFSAWNEKSDDSTLIVGRNFDFYVGDEFAKNKIALFCKPDSGYKFVMVTWGGMIGTVSGMNEKGLTVTLNAAKSDIPMAARTPISIIAREILQYAKNITEAYNIAKKRESFVSETIMVGSLEDNKTGLVQKTPSKTDLFLPAGNSVICTNHFQGTAFANDEQNCKNIRESSSMYRYNRVQELVDRYGKISVTDAARILRDRNGIADANIGMCNEKAVNQLIAHHSIIFKPAKLQVWISTGPFQLGHYVAYDLNRVFAEFPGLNENTEIREPDLSIPADSFLYSPGYLNFVKYKMYKHALRKKDPALLKRYERLVYSSILLNPEYFESYKLAGDYFKLQSDFNKAIKYYTFALTKEIPTREERVNIIREMWECKVRSEK